MVTYTDNYLMLQEATARGISKRPLLLRGTSLEAIEIALNTGCLPSSKHRRIKGWLYFTPVSNNFRQSTHAIRLEGHYSSRSAFSSARHYASMHAMTHYLQSEIGYIP